MVEEKHYTLLNWSLRRPRKKEASLLSSTVCLFGNQECRKINLNRNHCQNCRIGQPSTKNWVFLPDQFGPWPERKGKSGEIRSLLETLGGTLYPRNFLYLYQTWYGQQLLLAKKNCATHPTRGSLSKI